MAHWLNTGVVRAHARVLALHTFALLFVLIAFSPPSMGGSAFAADGDTTSCPDGNGGLTLPKGFCATIFADHVGAPRHMVVGADGTLYVNNRSRTRSSSGSLIALKDSKGDGHADINQTFGPPNSSGTGIAIHKNWLFVDIGDRIIRYTLAPGDIAPKGEPETVVSNIPIDGDHTPRPFAIDPQGNLFVDLGSATNSCQRDNRADQSPGVDPCVELKTRAGIWRFDANKTGQIFSAAERFATGLQLPVNVAFLPNPGTGPDDPFFYVTELYGSVKMVTRSGQISDYATGLLNFDPNGVFPGSGEMGLVGVVVEPISGDLFVSAVEAVPPETKVWKMPFGFAPAPVSVPVRS